MGPESVKKTQCDYCVFKYTEDQSSIEKDHDVEGKHAILRSLPGAPKRPRKTFVGGDDDKTETCFINSPNWPLVQKSQIYCCDFVDEVLSLETALDLREARRANMTARCAQIVAIIAAIIAAIAARADIAWLIESPIRYLLK